MTSSVWFGSIVAILASLFVVLAIILRTKQIKARERQQLAARTHERERIARDLHDTLLQGVQSLLLRIHIWANDPALPADLRSEIREVSAQAREIVVESRDRIILLRHGDRKESDLIATLHGMANARPESEAPSLEIITKGTPCPLTSDAYQQLHDIAREAIRNAIQHAQCQRIQVMVDYHPRSIVLTIADDGCGITPALLQPSGLAGHYGIVGMRERAYQLRAAFNLGPNGPTGAKVSVHVPASIAFAHDSRSAWSWLVNRWRSRKQ